MYKTTYCRPQIKSGKHPIQFAFQMKYTEDQTKLNSFFYILISLGLHNIERAYHSKPEYLVKSRIRFY